MSEGYFKPVGASLLAMTVAQPTSLALTLRYRIL